MIVSNTYHISVAFIEMPRMYQGISCLPTMNMQDPTCFFASDQDPNLKRSPNENGRKPMDSGNSRIHMELVLVTNNYILNYIKTHPNIGKPTNQPFVPWILYEMHRINRCHHPPPRPGPRCSTAHPLRKFRRFRGALAENSPAVCQGKVGKLFRLYDLYCILYMFFKCVLCILVYSDCYLSYYRHASPLYGCKYIK